MSTVSDVHVGDVGTQYVAEIQDAGAAFDPSTAPITDLIFKGPGITGALTRAATVTTTGTGGSQKWFLTYTSVAADVAAGLNSKAGTYSWQGYIEYSADEKWHTNVETYPVLKNLQ